MRIPLIVVAILLLPVACITPHAAAFETIVWTKAGSPYTINGQLILPAETTLIVEPGVTVRFGIDASIYANGPVVIRGDADDKVLFTSASLLPKPDDWYGVMLNGGASVENAIFEYAFYGLFLTSDSIVKDVVVRNNVHGIYALRCTATISRMTAEKNTMTGIYLDYSKAVIADVDVSGSSWGIYVYSGQSSATIERARVHDLTSNSIALTSIYNKVIIKDSVLDSKTDIFIPSINSNITLMNTSFGSVRMGYSNAIYVWNNLRVGAFDSVRGTPLANADVRIADSTGVKYRTSGYGGNDPRTGVDGFAPWVLLFDWSFDLGKKMQSSVEVSAMYRTQQEVRSVDVTYLHEEWFLFRGNAHPVAVLDVYQDLRFSLSMTGRKGNTLDFALLEDSMSVSNGSMMRTAGPPEQFSGTLKVRPESGYSIDLHYKGTVGANPVKLSFGSSEENLVLNSEKGKDQTLSIALDQMISGSLQGITTYTFDGSGSYDPDGMIVGYAWVFGDGGVANGITAVHTYVSPGTFVVTLTVTDDAGDVSSASSTITIP